MKIDGPASSTALPYGWFNGKINLRQSHYNIQKIKRNTIKREKNGCPDNGWGRLNFHF